jgi:predicted RNase H-like HicB family nuclease
MSDMRIFKSEGWYVAEIPSLHVVTRAKNMSSLEKNIKEAVEVAIEGMLALKSIKITKTKTKNKNLQVAYA